MATTLPAAGRTIGEIIRGAAILERILKATGAIPQDHTQEADCTKEGDATDCNKCKLQDGMVAPSIPRRSVMASNMINWDYQLYIANLHASPAEQFTYCDKTTGVPLTNFDFAPGGRVWKLIQGQPQPVPENLNLTEWLWNNYFWDGFWREECCVVEAKGRFSKHLDEDGLPKMKPPSSIMFPGMIRQAASQVGYLAPALPQAKLQWHFMEPEVFAWAQANIPPPVTCVHTPYAPRILM
ncbi:hypothetical protein H8Z72_23220 (plasmid) [Xanthomonas citri pv. citri]|uniref:Tox-REase-5 domain-containing protein n=1 Tax=Xanthomonas citri TaxID=346 RepID=UPI0019322820|nr:Tox-REase-5 domain-containing protein [Xanthomonas citri]QRD62773.1 hypothetical protein H8Z74_22965 [Xanthomonas citri pv. citri]QRD67100.1 hypothetical protein H8Z73_23050 [Xanthomonas citri pv. citri]QRD71647.1 hypothetical protein H8Z72_23220 [Xanthomonas citri pv. citri]